MSSDGERMVETVTLRQACELIQCLAAQQSILLLSPPGMGKSDIVHQAAAEAKLPCRSLLGTQIAPEDVSGIPRIIGERSVFCPPRVLLPENPEPFCLFLDEMPACTPDVQKAFYSLLLERRIGEHRLPAGSWVVAAGNRAEDRALVRTISSALVNRVIMLHVRVDVPEWLDWAARARVRPAIRNYIRANPEALLRPIPRGPVPFSTPRAWASLSRALDLAETAGILDDEIMASLAAGRVSEEDVDPIIAWLRAGGVTQASSPQESPRSSLVMPIEDLNLSVRATNILLSEGINTVGELIIRTREELLEIRNCNETALQSITDALAEHGLSLAASTTPTIV